MARPARKRKKPNVDPELLRQLDAAEASSEPVEAVFTLNPEKGALPSPDRVEQLAYELVDRAKRASGGTVEDMNVFRNMASFVTKADAGVVRHLLQEPAIAGGVANRQPDA